jgi:hypothetical protein
VAEMEWSPSSIFTREACFAYVVFALGGASRFWPRMNRRRTMRELAKGRVVATYGWIGCYTTDSDLLPTRAGGRGTDIVFPAKIGRDTLALRLAEIYVPLFVDVDRSVQRSAHRIGRVYFLDFVCGLRIPAPVRAPRTPIISARSLPSMRPTRGRVRPRFPTWQTSFPGLRGLELPFRRR